MTAKRSPGSFGGTYCVHLPAVMATLWRAGDGRTAVAVCNMDDASHAVDVAAPSGPLALTLEPREARVVGGVPTRRA